MAQIKISELENTSTLDAKDLFVIVDDKDAVTKNTTLGTITEYMKEHGGGGSKTSQEVFVQPTKPDTDDWKLWIDTTEEMTAIGSEVIDSLSGDEHTLAPSVRAIKDALFYKSGDSYIVGSYTPPVVGVITGSAMEIDLTFQVPKKMTNISNITVNNARMTLRGTQGYVGDYGNQYYDYITDNNYTVTAQKVDDCNVKIILKKSTAFTSVTNNTPIAAVLGGNFKITFS